jgi:hypothetical protein
MSLKKIEKQSRKILLGKKTVDGKKAAKIVQLILADKLISRSEKRFVKTLMTQWKCDPEAIDRFKNILAS